VSDIQVGRAAPNPGNCNAKEIHLLTRLRLFARLNWSSALRSDSWFHPGPDKIGTSVPSSANAFERFAKSTHAFLKKSRLKQKPNI